MKCKAGFHCHVAAHQEPLHPHTHIREAETVAQSCTSLLSGMGSTSGRNTSLPKLPWRVPVAGALVAKVALNCLTFLPLPVHPPVSPGELLGGCYGDSKAVLKQCMAAVQECFDWLYLIWKDEVSVSCCLASWYLRKSPEFESCSDYFSS